MSEFSLQNVQTLSDKVLPSMLFVIRTNSAFAKERDAIFRSLSGLKSEIGSDVSLLPLLQHDVREVDSMSEFDNFSDYFQVCDSTDDMQVINIICFFDEVFDPFLVFSWPRLWRISDMYAVQI
jgi:hypothetical protein